MQDRTTTREHLALEPTPADSDREQLTKEQIWQHVVEIGTQERHFNGIQARYRGMASGWLIATFSAIGFVVSNKLTLDIDSDLLVAMIAAAGCIGIALLWIVDLQVYHRLLDSCFAEGLILEARHAWLPPVRRTMLATQQDRGVQFRIVGFYQVPIVALCSIAGCFLARWLASEGMLAEPVGFAGAAMAAGLAGWLVGRRTKGESVIRDRFQEARASGGSG